MPYENNYRIYRIDNKSGLLHYVDNQNAQTPRDAIDRWLDIRSKRVAHLQPQQRVVVDGAFLVMLNGQPCQVFTVEEVTLPSYSVKAGM